MDHDGSADVAARMWRDNEDGWPRVWLNLQAADHYGVTYYLPAGSDAGSAGGPDGNVVVVN